MKLDIKSKCLAAATRIKRALARDNLKKTFSKENLKRSLSGENTAKTVFSILATVSIITVFGIIYFIFIAATPIFSHMGFFNFLFESEWNPITEVYGLLPKIVGSLVLTALSVAIGGFMGVFTAAWITFYCPNKIRGIFIQLVNLLAGIPSIIYGLFGYKFVMPLLIEMFALGDTSSIGNGLMASTVILSIMIIPTVTAVTRNSLDSVPMHYYEGALALGCTKNQSVFRVLIPAAKSGIISALLLGLGRAVGETMAVQMLVGGSDGFPWGFFTPFSTLTSVIVRDLGYAPPLQRAALMGSGFVLLIIILLINICLASIKNGEPGNKFFTRRFREGRAAERLTSFRRTGGVQDALWITSWVVAVFVAAFLVFIVTFVFWRGLPYLSFDFLFGKSSNSHITLGPAFVSTLMLIGLALAIALPFGIGAAIYLNEYSKRGSKFVKVVRLFIDTLSGIPSIVFGMFGMVLFMRTLHWRYCLAAGSITLAAMILPTVIRSVEQSLSEVPDSMREASYALGAGKLRTIFIIVLPQALSGIVTAIILSIGRIVSESAVLIYTAGESIFMPTGYKSSGASLAVMIYSFMCSARYWNEAYATASALLIVVAFLNLAVWLTERFIYKKSK